MKPLIDYAVEINRARHAYRRKRRLAQAGVLLAALLSVLGTGMLIAQVGQGWFSALATNIMLWGFWGGAWLWRRS